MANHYEVPSWAGKPPTGLHLDVLKGDKLIQKLMLDEKKCYLFGRNPQMNDFCIDHASCSRVHAAFVYHKDLNRAFLVDLGSTHGTYIGKMRLEANKPTQLPIDSTFHFGASTRNYIIRERPTGNSRGIMEDLPNTETEGALLGLPETQTELDNLTEFNTAHNRRISMLGISTEDGTDVMKPAAGTKRSSSTSAGVAKKRRNVSFNEEVDIINPEDIDPSVGRFRNLVRSTIVPSAAVTARRARLHADDSLSAVPQQHSLRLQEMSRSALYADLPAPAAPAASAASAAPAAPTSHLSIIGARLGLSLPNPAPDVELEGPEPHLSVHPPLPHAVPEEAGPSSEPKKKKYAKEAWPGRKPGLISGV
ncbi:PREDICTED: nuclear inhibitor of protein phosphatase 1 [Papilio polytes]|uniref:nuclear inhibitor of protein phosphatase 1 n=1 Tax=Papilio polytes TaxID=76194 RepID=UPI0006765B7C|nr:PREDICTED: nuclear inhibitor of protein phosphatase 1 [Papilio polytes]